MKTKLTEKIAKEGVDFIINISGNTSEATLREYILREWFIQCLSERMYTIDEAAAIAKVIAKTSEIEFIRSEINID